MKPRLELWEQSPLWDVLGESVVGFDLSMTLGWSLRGLDPTCLDADGLGRITDDVSRVLRAIPEGYIFRIHTHPWSQSLSMMTHYAERQSGSAIGRRFGQARVSLMEETITQRPLQISCSLSTPGAFRLESLSSLFGGTHFGREVVGRHAKRMQARAESALGERYQKLLMIRELVVNKCNAAGLSAEYLDSDGLLDALFGWANPARSQMFSRPRRRGEISLRSQLFSSGLKASSSHLERDGRFYRVLSMKLLPEQSWPLMLTLSQSLPFEVSVVSTVRRIGSDKALARLERRRNAGFELGQMRQRFSSQAAVAEKPDHGLSRQQQDVNAVLGRLHGGEGLFEVSAQWMVEASSLDDLNRRTEALVEAVRDAGGMEVAVEEFRQSKAYLSMLPGHHALIGERYHTLLERPVVGLLPLFESSSGAERPSFVMSTRLGGALGFEPFDPKLSAWNAVVSASTGAGKSFMAKCLLSGFCGAGGRLVVVTLGRDYHRFVDVFKGSKSDVHPDDATLSLDPFVQLRKTKASREALLLTSRVLGLMVESAEVRSSRHHKRILFETLREVVDESGGVLPRSFVLTDYIARLRRSEDEAAEQLAVGLVDWLSGPLGPALLREAKKSPGRVSLWNLQFLEDEATRSVVLGLIANQIAHSIGRGPTVVVLDEVWSLMKSEAGSELVETLYRTVRKEGSAIWSITQSVNDYLSLPPSARSAVLNNAPMKILLRHDATDVPVARELFDLNGREAEILGGLESSLGHFSDALLLMGDTRHVVRLYPTSLEYWMATSHKSDVLLAETFEQERPNLGGVSLLEALAKRHPVGRGVKGGYRAA